MENKKDLKKISKKILNKNHHKKIKKIKDKDDRTEALKYLIYSLLQLKHIDLEHKLDKMRQDKKECDIFYIEQKLKAFPAKLDFFKIDFSLSHFEKLNEFFDEIENKIKNV